MIGRLLLLFVASGLAVQAQGVTPDVRFQRLSLDLPHPEVQALAQDRDGLIWIGTADGLVRYDGLDVTVLRRRAGDRATLPSNGIQALLADRRGVLWIGTDRGLARHDARTDRMTHASPARGACAGGVVWLAEDADGRIVYGARAQGVCRLDPASGRTERVVLPWDGAGSAWSLAQVQGAIWVLGSDPREACRLDDGRQCRAIDLKGFQPRVLGLDAEGRLLAYGRAAPGAAPELRRWSRGRFVPVARDLPPFGGSEGGRLVVVGREAWLTTASDGVLAVGLETGAWRWLAPVPGDPTSVPAERVQAVLVDRQGATWLGTARGLAVWRAPVRPFTLYRRFRGLEGEISDDRVNGMTEGRDGSLWVSTNDGLNRLDPASGRFETYWVSDQRSGPPGWPPPPGPYQDAWWQVLEGSDGTLWVGGKRNGLFRLDHRTGLYRHEMAASRVLGRLAPDGEPRGFGVRHVYEDPSGHLWVGTTGEGLAVRHPETGDWNAIRPVAGDSSLPHPSVNRVFQDAKGRLWVGTDAGVAQMLHPDRAEPTFAALDLGEEVPVWALGESSATPGDLWIGTVGAGLVRYTPETGRTIRYTTDQGLPSDRIYGVLADGEGRVWASTGDGLVRLDPRTGALAVYNEAHGLQGDAFDLMAFYRSPTTGEMWFGGPNGLSRIDPAGVGVAAYRPPVAFTSVLLRDDRQPGRPLDGDTLRVAHDDNFLTVQFAALDLTAPRDLRYRYRLVGVDDGWRETTGKRPFATYTALAPGTYRLEVLGANADGVRNDEPIVLTVEVVPAWWQRMPVRALAVLVLALLGVGGMLGVMRQAARSHRQEAALVGDALHEGPIRRIGEIGPDIDRIGGDGHAEVVARVRQRVGDVEQGLHDALLRLHPDAVGRLGLVHSLDATLRRFRRAAPSADLQADWSQAPRGLAPEAAQAVVEVVTNLVGYVLRVAQPDRLAVSVRARADETRIRVEADGDAPLSPAAFRTRIGRRTSGLARVLRIVRAAGGHLDVAQTETGSAVEVRLPVQAEG